MSITTEHAERFAVLRHELAAALSHPDPADFDGSRLASIASATLWAAELARTGRNGVDDDAFHERTGNAWLRHRAACGDCPRAAARAYASQVLQAVSGGASA
jgi:hypothetical protein